MGKTTLLLVSASSVAPGVPLSEDPWELLPEGPRRMLAKAASDEFGKRGFHATTTRDIAVRVGMSPAGLYVHYASKADLLFAISRIGHQAALGSVSAAVLGLVSPAKRVRALVKAFTAWHAVNHGLARVLQYELRSLMPAHYQEIAGIRSTTERQVANELRSFVHPETELKITTNAVLSLGIDVARWYESEKGPTPDALGEKYAQLVMDMLRTTRSRRSQSAPSGMTRRLNN